MSVANKSTTKSDYNYISFPKIYTLPPLCTKDMVHRHILIQTFPAQGSLNPCLQLAKNLARMGVQVTVLVSLSVQRRMDKNDHTMKGVRIVAFSDGYDDGVKFGPKMDYDHFMSQLKNRGSEALSEIIITSAKEGFPVTRLVYTMLQPWAAEVARNLSIQYAVLWCQPATVFDIYYYYFYGDGDGDGDVFKKIINDPSSSVQLPGLPHLTSQDLPTLMLPSNPCSFNQLPRFKEQLETLDLELKPIVLVNTFDDLESGALQAIDKYNLVAIGPLVPSAYLEEKDSSENSFGADLIEKSNYNYIEWLDTKQEKSVVYVSFGSFQSLPEIQMEEIASGLVKSGRPFLWVVRYNAYNDERLESNLSCKDELNKLGVIVPWCSQVEVLSHTSLGCFVTHCGWNSSMESLVTGVPVVGLPQFTDQPTNAKLLQDEFKIGVRAKSNDKGVVEGDEIKRCVDLVFGCKEVGKNIRENAKKWKCLAKKAAKEGGSSSKNLKAFVDEV